MQSRSYFPLIVQAACAAAGGLAAHLLWQEPALTIVAAALSATATSLLTMLDEPGGSSVPPQEPPPRVRKDSNLAVLQALPFGAIIVSGDGTIRAANRSADELFGPPALTNQSVRMVRSPRLLDGVAKVRAERKELDVEFTIPRASDSYFKAHITALPGQSVLLLIDDETENRRSFELHRDFVANASHQLKTPLTAISFAVQALSGPARDDPEGTEMLLAQLAENTERMERLIADHIALNRIEQNERVAPDTSVLIFGIANDAASNLKAIAERAKIELNCALPAPGPMIMGDTKEMSHLFAILIENSIKYSDAGDTVSIRPADAHLVGPGETGVTVEDNGIGIPREHIPRLTERFFRVEGSENQSRNGTGLGLAIAKHILNRHGGKLHIESNLGEGAQFTVLLPQANMDTQNSSS